MSVVSEVEAALFMLIDSAASISDIPKSFPDRKFNRPDGSFLVVRDFPTRPLRYLVPSKNSHRYTGFLQVSAYTKANLGVTKHKLLRDLIVDLFPTDLRIATSSGLSIRITQDVHIGAGYNDGDHYTSPMSIYYEIKG